MGMGMAMAMAMAMAMTKRFLRDVTRKTRFRTPQNDTSAPRGKPWCKKPGAKFKEDASGETPILTFFVHRKSAEKYVLLEKN